MKPIPIEIWLAAIVAGTAIGTLIVSVAALWMQSRNGAEIRNIHVQINSRMDQLLQVTAAAERAQGAIQGAAAERALSSIQVPIQVHMAPHPPIPPAPPVPAVEKPPDAPISHTAG